MGTCLLFITARNADAKSINRMLLHLHDWEFESGDRFRVITTSNELPSDPTPTSPQITDFTDDTNEWAGKPVAQVETFVREQVFDRREERSPYSDVAVIADEQGMRERTCIVVERDVDDSEDFRYLDTFKKVRVPWDDVYTMWCNLDIANMGFEEFCDEEKGDVGDGWWEYKAIHGDDTDREGDEGQLEKEAALRELEES